MPQKSQIIGIVAAAAMLVATQSGSASAAPHAACSLMTLAEVRAIVGPTVEIYQPSSAGPTVHGVNTVSNCTYMPHGTADTWKGAGSGFYSLMWGPAATLTTGLNVYAQRHWLARIKGDVLVTATVSNGKRVDAAASSKLLEAVLRKL